VQVGLTQGYAAEAQRLVDDGGIEIGDEVPEVVGGPGRREPTEENVVLYRDRDAEEARASALPPAAELPVQLSRPRERESSLPAEQGDERVGLLAISSGVLELLPRALLACGPPPEKVLMVL